MYGECLLTLIKQFMNYSQSPLARKVFEDN